MQPLRAEGTMGLVRVRKSLIGKKVGGRFKKQFWVVNIEAGEIECYKSDQDHAPIKIIDGHHIQGVRPDDVDKRNKFFDLKVILASGKQRVLRMNSKAERDKWHRAFSQLQDKAASSYRLSNLIAAVKYRLAAYEAEFRIKLQCDLTKFGAEVPQELFPCCVEAIDEAATLLRDVLQPTEGSPPPPLSSADITLALGHATLRSSRATSAGIAYDPSKKRLHFTVTIIPRADGTVTFNHDDAETIRDVLSSPVWRDPSIEGWIELDAECAKVRKEIAVLLNQGDFKISIQWGTGVPELPDQVRRQYLRRYITFSLLEDMLSVFTRAIRAPRTVFGSDPHRHPLLTYVVGVVMQLEVDTIGKEAPPLMKLTLPEKHANAIDALIGLSKFRVLRRRLKGPAASMSVTNDASKIAPMVHLRRQIDDLCLYNCIAAGCQAGQQLIDRALQLKDGVGINWVTLMAAAAAQEEVVTEACLPMILFLAGVIYARRLGDLRLKGITPQILGKYVSSTVLQVFTEGGELPPLSTHSGVLVDSAQLVQTSSSEEVVLLGDAFEYAKAALSPTADGVPTETSDFAHFLVDDIHVPRSVCKLAIQFSVPQLGVWLQSLLSDPTRSSLAIRRVASNTDDDDDSSSDLDDLEGLQEQENVAAERSVETRELRLVDVINIAYDSQEGSPVALKAGADLICASIVALDKEFPSKRIVKHDLIGILSNALRYLRVCFVNAQRGGDSPTGAGATFLFNRDQVGAILKEYCEFEETYPLIPKALDAAAASLLGADTPSLTARHRQRVDSSGTFDAHLYDFPTVAYAAMVHLLPKETKRAVSIHKIVPVVGLEGVGKSLIINNIQGTLEHTLPTIGISKKVVAYKETIFSFHELGGREDFRKNWQQYFKLLGHIDGLIVVVDARADVKQASCFSRDVLGYSPFKGVPVLFVFNNYTPPGVNEGGQRAAMADPPVKQTKARHISRVVKAMGVPDLAASGNHPFSFSACRVTSFDLPEDLDIRLEQGLDWLVSNMAMSV